MEAQNPFTDPDFKKKLMENEASGSSQDYEILDSSEPDFKSIITGAPKIPQNKTFKNLILDASALAKNEKEQKAEEMTTALNTIFTEYNKEYGTDLQIDFNNLSKTLVNVSDPKSRHTLELYVSEVFKSIKPILTLHLIQKLSLALDYCLDVSRLFDSNSFSPADLFLVIEKIMGYLDSLSTLYDELVTKGSDLELKRLAEEKNNADLDTPESRAAVDAFMALLRKDNK